jgi:hypothetical protein
VCPESIAPTLALLWLNEPFEYQEAVALEPADLVGRQSSGRVRQPVRGWRVVLQSVRASQGGGAACSVVSQQVMVSSSGHAQGFGGLALAHHKGLDGQADRRHPYIALARHAAAVRQRATAAGPGPGSRRSTDAFCIKCSAQDDATAPAEATLGRWNKGRQTQGNKNGKPYRMKLSRALL